MTIHDEFADLQVAQDEYEAARTTIVNYIEDTSMARARLAAEGHLRQIFTVLSAEMALAGSLGQIDVVRRLGEMAETIMHAEATLHVKETEDYRRHFGEGVRSDSDTALRET
tara:strand:+ start:3962 stop:4297 length:336 start_codon:yes stop_codon:yes gene_type:complete